ncbi:MAG: PilZ domain-containing protein [Spirochaetaceae bacterium]|jgi:Tfp pilus assembly protein PilZ|nr:PilZ domain-containing protein [Spirochaetaceae bacterium]
MGKLKVIVKRPLNHYLIIIIYIMAPIMNILMIRIMGQVPFQLIIRNFFNGFGLIDGLWMITAPLVGIGFYFVNKTSWYIFIIHSSLILIDFIYKWFSRPVYFIKTISGSYNALMFAGNILLILIVGYVIQKNFRAPYFQTLQRHWRENVRIPIQHVISIDSNQMNINDLSSGGCFVLKEGKDLSLENEHKIFFKSDLLDINCRGKIMRQTETGYGIMFTELTSKQKKNIRSFLKKRFSLRQKINKEAQWIVNGISINGTMLDISKGGCFLESHLDNIKENSSGTLAVTVLNTSYNIHAKITWINHSGEHNKPDGFGCSFNINQKGLLKQILEENGISELTR